MTILLRSLESESPDKIWEFSPELARVVAMGGIIRTYTEIASFEVCLEVCLPARACLFKKHGSLVVADSGAGWLEEIDAVLRREWWAPDSPVAKDLR